jgi:addiction module HigA family antidote
MIFNPCHPGEVLKDYLGDMTVKEAAKRLGVTRPNLSRILNGRAGISAEMGVRLGKAMPYTSPEFWLKMQLNYDLWKARKNRLPRIRRFPVRLQKSLVAALDGRARQAPAVQTRSPQEVL